MSRASFQRPSEDGSSPKLSIFDQYTVELLTSSPRATPEDKFGLNFFYCSYELAYIFKGYDEEWQERR